MLTEVSASGAVTHQVAVELTSQDHASLAADPGGQWLLYLSGHDLFLSDEGGEAFALTTGLIAAAWR